MIGLGAALVHKFSWILFLFAAFLIVTGIKMIVFADKDIEAAGALWIGLRLVGGQVVVGRAALFKPAQLSAHHIDQRLFAQRADQPNQPGHLAVTGLAP